MLSLTEYIKCAEKCIIKYGSRCYLSDENIGYVANMMMNADLKFNEGWGSRDGFRIYYARFAIKNIKKNSMRKKNKRMVQLDFAFGEEKHNMYSFLVDRGITQEDKVILNDIIEYAKSNFSYKMYSCLVLHYIHNMTLSDTGKQLNISKQAVHKLISKAVNRLKEKFSNVELD